MLQKKTGGGILTPSRVTRSLSSSSIIVSPDLTFLQPIMAPISPTEISERSCVSSALTLNRAEILSTSLSVAFLNRYLFFNVPEYTLKKVTSPFSLSLTTLNASAHSLSFLIGLTVIFSFVV